VLNADTGKLLWEYKSTCIRATCRRIASGGPRLRPTRDGQRVLVGVNNLLTPSRGWQEALGALRSRKSFRRHHARRTDRLPIIDGNLVIVSTPTSPGEHAQRQQRFIALDKRTGDIIWISTPGGRPYDTKATPR